MSDKDLPSDEDVTVAEMRECIAELLLLDREWIVERDDGFDWFGSELRLAVDVIGEGRFPEGGQEKWLKLRSRVEIFGAEADEGLEITAALNRDFAMGAFVLDEGRLCVQSTFIFHALSRGLMRQFAIQALAQATVAKLIRDEFEGDPAVSVFAHAHPELGVRGEPDDILDVYRGPKTTIEINDDFVERLDQVRLGPLRDLLLKDWQQGFNDFDVNFYQNHLVGMGIGVLHGTPEFERFGPGIMVNVMSMRRLLDFDFNECNEANLLIGELEMVSQFGPMRLAPVGADPIAASASIFAQLPYASLVHLVENPRAMMVQMLNFATHTAGAMVALEHYFERAEAEE